MTTCLPAFKAVGLMMQQVQFFTVAVLDSMGPELGKKNSISRAASSGQSDPCTALYMLSVEIIITIIIIINNNKKKNNDYNNYNNNRIQRRNLRFFLQSPHCVANLLQHVRSSDPGAIVCKSCATHRALITCNMSCYVPHGTKG